MKGYQYVHSKYVGGKVIFRVNQDKVDMVCPSCSSCQVKMRGSFLRRFKAVPIGMKPVVIELPVQRIECRDCGVVRQVDIGFADERRSYTKAFERYVLELSRHMTMRDVARHLGVGWDLVKDIQKRNLQRRFRHIRLKELKRIAIDEISIGRGHRYLTVVLDLISGAVVFVGNGKGTDALEPFWKRIKISGAVIKAVAMDMSPSFILSAHTHLPGATIVFDHFHMIKLFNDKLSELRRDIQREAEGPLQKEVLKGTRWLLLKNPENLNDKHHERRHLEEALSLNAPLAAAYYMKEYLREVWNQQNKKKHRFSLTIGLPRPGCPASECLSSSPILLFFIVRVYLPGMIFQSQQDHWREQTTRSRLFNGRLMASGITSSSSSRSMRFMRLSML
jgi:transposase